MVHTACRQAVSCLCTSSSCSRTGMLPAASASSHWHSSCCAHSRTGAFLSDRPLLSSEARSSALHCSAEIRYWTLGALKLHHGAEICRHLHISCTALQSIRAFSSHRSQKLLRQTLLSEGHLRYCIGTRSLMAAKAIFLTCSAQAHS